MSNRDINTKGNVSRERREAARDAERSKQIAAAISEWNQMTKRELLNLVYAEKRKRGLRLIYGVPYASRTKDELISELITTVFPRDNA